MMKYLSAAINIAALAATAVFFIQLFLRVDVNFAAYAGTFAGLYWVKQLVKG